MSIVCWEDIVCSNFAIFYRHYSLGRQNRLGRYGNLAHINTFQIIRYYTWRTFFLNFCSLCSPWMRRCIWFKLYPNMLNLTKKAISQQFCPCYRDCLIIRMSHRQLCWWLVCAAKKTNKIIVLLYAAVTSKSNQNSCRIFLQLQLFLTGAKKTNKQTKEKQSENQETKQMSVAAVKRGKMPLPVVADPKGGKMLK